MEVSFVKVAPVFQSGFTSVVVDVNLFTHCIPLPPPSRKVGAG